MGSPIDASQLVSFSNAAAGHDGVLSDETGTVVIKPCTPAEIAFYETAHALHPELATFMPKFMGTLQLASNTPLASEPQQMAKSNDATPPTQTAISEKEKFTSVNTAATLLPAELRLKGKPLDTDLHIVLENVAAGFSKPNILDLKLGARLWDDDAPEAKRARLDAVSGQTTSGSLGFRVAGMRVWQGSEPNNDEIEFTAVEAETNTRVYNKMYGRTRSVDNVVDAFLEYVLQPKAGVPPSQARAVVQSFLLEIDQIHDVLEKLESRMYSSSILLVYEGDAAAFEQKLKKMQEKVGDAFDNLEGEEGEDEDEDEIEDKLYEVKLIDFAHARIVPGQGSDENMLKGVRSIRDLLDQVLVKLGDD